MQIPDKFRAEKLIPWPANKQLEDVSGNIKYIEYIFFGKKTSVNRVVTKVEALGIEKDQINIKATTEEGLGFTGSGEGISSQAIAALETIANYSYKVEPEEEDACGNCKGCPRGQKE